MKILLAHNRYQIKGGEDTAYEGEREMLLARGHEIVDFVEDNHKISTMSNREKFSLLWGASWSDETHQKITDLCAREKPDIAHFHNVRPLITPSAFYACQSAGVPVVVTLHNYRLLCPAGQFLREGKICEQCVEKSLLRCIMHRCYRNSFMQSAAVVHMTFRHRKLATYEKIVDTIITPSEFLKQKLIDNGFDRSKIEVKPNSVAGIKKSETDKGYALFLGRLSHEKGAHVALEAFSKLFAFSKIDNFQLKVAGDGPMAQELYTKYSDNKNIEFMGLVEREEAYNLIANCRFVVLPSICYENFPMTIAESFASGKPVIISRLGAPAGIVEEGVTGLMATHNDPDDLAEKMEVLIKNSEMARRMGNNARDKFEKEYSAEMNMKRLESIYEQTLEKANRSETN
jgi:glycosyltransferase involved in cell wall biosynthesis